MGGVTKAFKHVTSAVTKPFQQIAKAAAKPIKSVVGSIMPDKQVPTATATADTAPAPPAADVNVAATTAATQTEETTKRAGLMRSAKGKKSLTVSRSSGGGLNV